MFHVKHKTPRYSKKNCETLFAYNVKPFINQIPTASNGVFDPRDIR